jgi:hypothetical protein
VRTGRLASEQANKEIEAMKKDIKKTTIDLARRRTLVLRREAIVELTPAQLGELVRGGGSVGITCSEPPFN